MGVKPMTVSTYLHRLGIQRQKASWVDAAWEGWQVEYLLANWRTQGDTEIAEALGFKGRKPCKRVWKKRQHLGLHREKGEVAAIRRRNIEAGRHDSKRAGTDHHAYAPLGTIRLHHREDDHVLFVVKVAPGEGTRNGGQWEVLSRHVWAKAHGPIPPGHVVRFTGADPMDPAQYTPGNLMLVTLAEHAAMNSRSRKMLPPELRRVRQLLKELNKTIKTHER